MHMHSIIIIWENKPYTTFTLYQIPGGSPTVVVLLYLSLCVVLNVLLITDLLQEGVALVSRDLPVDRVDASLHGLAPAIDLSTLRPLLSGRPRGAAPQLNT